MRRMAAGEGTSGRLPGAGPAKPDAMNPKALTRPQCADRQLATAQLLPFLDRRPTHAEESVRVDQSSIIANPGRVLERRQALERDSYVYNFMQKHLRATTSS